MPTKATIQKQISLYFNENLEDCLSNINEQTFDIRFQNPSTKITIEDKEVTFDITLPNKIEKDKYTTNLEIEPIAIPSELLSILVMAEYITESHKQDPALYCINCVAALAKENDLYVDNIGLEGDKVLVVISEHHTSETPYLFSFVNSYTGNEQSPLQLEELAPEVEYE